MNVHMRKLDDSVFVDVHRKNKGVHGTPHKVCYGSVI